MTFVVKRDACKFSTVVVGGPMVLMMVLMVFIVITNGSL